MRLFYGGISTETNSFSPIPVALGTFERQGILRGGDETEPRMLARTLPAYALSRGIEVIPGLYADAPPGAPVARHAYESLRDELLDRLRAAGAVDIVALDLHGGMIADGYDDPEGDLIARVRAIVGPDVAIGAVFDPHAHLSPAMSDNADIMLFYRENPHLDISERQRELVDLLIPVARGQVKPVTSVYDMRQADLFQTNREPMRAFVDRTKAMEGRDGVLSISIVHGFRRGDVPFMGGKVVVITDDRKAWGDALAQRLGRELWEMRGTAATRLVPLDEAVDLALAATAFPVTLGDVADNPGGGAPGDATYILKALLARGARDIAIGAMIDPLAIRIALEAGEGGRAHMRIGGKMCPLSGEPIDVEVVVRRINRQAKQRFAEGDEIDFGTTVALYAEAEGVEFVLTDDTHQTYTPDPFLDLGVDLASKRFIIVKSAQHYRAWFGPYVGTDFAVGAPGVCSEILGLPFKRITRPLWPFDENPFEQDPS